MLMKKGIVFRRVCLFNSDPNTLSVIGASSVTSDMLRFSEMKDPELLLFEGSGLKMIYFLVSDISLTKGGGISSTY